MEWIQYITPEATLHTFYFWAVIWGVQMVVFIKSKLTFSNNLVAVAHTNDISFFSRIKQLSCIVDDCYWIEFVSCRSRILGNNVEEWPVIIHRPPIEPQLQSYNGNMSVSVWRFGCEDSPMKPRSIDFTLSSLLWAIVRRDLGWWSRPIFCLLEPITFHRRHT